MMRFKKKFDKQNYKYKTSFFVCRFSNHKIYIFYYRYRQLVMFPNTKPCLYKETNDRYSNLFVGFLVIMVIFICVGIAMGCWGILNRDHTDFYLDNTNKFSLNVFESSSGNKDFVTVAQGKSFDDVDTEVGKIEVVSEYLPDWSVLPLCIEDADVANYYVNLKVTGGYKPRDLCNDWYIKFYQDLDNDKSTKEYVGTIDILVDKLDEHSTCCYTVYQLTFDVLEDCIRFDSNHYPDIPAGWDLFPKDPECTDLDKLVDVDISTEWEGCCNPCQRFEIILPQKNILISGIPNTRNINSR